MRKGESKLEKAKELKDEMMKVIDEMMKISQSEEKIIKQVDEIKNIRVDPSLYNFDIFYQLSSPTQVYDNRYVDENGI